MAVTSDPAIGQRPIVELFEERPIGALQWRVFAFCLGAGLFEGFDSMAVGFTAPAMSRDLSIPLSQFGWILSATQIGVVVGAFLFGPIADRIGRKWLITISMFIVGIFALATVMVRDFAELLTVRFVMGLGAGGALAVFAVLAGEYAPPRSKFTIVSAIWISVPAGGLLAALVSSLVLDTLGWQIIYLIGGGFTIVLAIAMAAFLPESPSFLIVRNAPPEKVDTVLQRIWPGNPVPQALWTVEETPGEKASVLALFQSRYRRLTLVLWLAAFGDYLAVLVIVTWSTSLLSNAGMTTSSAALIVMVNNLGGLLGILTIGRILQTWSPRVVLAAFLVMGAAATLSMAQTAPAFGPTVVLSGLSGFFLGGCVAGLSAIATVYYPTSVRSSGVGWLLGVGRTGGILGTLLVGEMVGWNWSIVAIYTACCVPVVIAAFTVLLLRKPVQQAG